jgi:hypothetical protein
MDDFRFVSVSWVRVWAHTNTMLCGQPGHPINLVGTQRARIRGQAPHDHRSWRATWRQITPVLQQLEDGNTMAKINA